MGSGGSAAAAPYCRRLAPALAPTAAPPQPVPPPLKLGASEETKALGAGGEEAEVPEADEARGQRGGGARGAGREQTALGAGGEEAEVPELARPEAGGEAEAKERGPAGSLGVRVFLSPLAPGA